MFTSNLLIPKCVSKVPGHLSKPAAPTSVPGLLRHILQCLSDIVTVLDRDPCLKMTFIVSILIVRLSWS